MFSLFWRFGCQNPSTTAFWLKQLTARCANGSVYDSAWAVGKLTKNKMETQSHMCLCQQRGLSNPFQEFSIQTDAGFLEKYLHVDCMFLQVFWVFLLLPLLYGFEFACQQICNVHSERCHSLTLHCQTAVCPNQSSKPTNQPTEQIILKLLLKHTQIPFCRPTPNKNTDPRCIWVEKAMPFVPIGSRKAHTLLLDHDKDGDETVMENGVKLSGCSAVWR